MSFSTTVEAKRKYWPIFAALISSQFETGGDKYKLQGFDDREATDVISSVFGGKSDFDWVLGTMMKYIFRFKNFEREKDLLKIATYCFILWLKQGNHLKTDHDEDKAAYAPPEDEYTAQEKKVLGYNPLEECGPDCELCESED